jgi:hypothetical protein
MELQWAGMLLADTVIITDEADAEVNIVQWHTAGSTLYIMCKDRQEIDLRLEREICEIQVELLFCHSQAILTKTS